MDLKHHQRSLRDFSARTAQRRKPPTQQDEEWAAVITAADGRTMYIASVGTRNRYGQPTDFTAYRGSSARFDSEPAALARAYMIKDAKTPRGGWRLHPWITDVRAERIR